MKRSDDYNIRREALKGLSDARLEQRFWELAECVTAPLVEMARTHTSPSIERSVLLRMGFTSLEAKEIVHHCQKNALLGKGAGHVLLRYAKEKGIGLREAGLILGQGRGWEEAAALFRKAVKVWS